MKVEVTCDCSQETLEQLFRKALANALDVPLKQVVKLLVSEIGSGKGLRRLQPARTRQYEIAYEVVVPSSMDPDLVVGKANRITVAGSAESQVFRQELMATDCLSKVHQVVMKIPAHIVKDETITASPNVQADQDNDTTTASWLFAILMVVLGCLVACIYHNRILLQRMMAIGGKDEGQASKSLGGEADGVNLINGQPSKVQLSGSGEETVKAAKGEAEDLEGVVISLPLPDAGLNDGCDEARKALYLARKSAAPTFKAADQPSKPELNGDEAVATQSCGVWI